MQGITMEYCSCMMLVRRWYYFDWCAIEGMVWMQIPQFDLLGVVKKGLNIDCGITATCWTYMRTISLGSSCFSQYFIIDSIDRNKLHTAPFILLTLPCCNIYLQWSSPYLCHTTICDYQMVVWQSYVAFSCPQPLLTSLRCKKNNSYLFSSTRLIASLFQISHMFPFPRCFPVPVLFASRSSSCGRPFSYNYFF